MGNSLEKNKQQENNTVEGFQNRSTEQELEKMSVQSQKNLLDEGTTDNTNKDITDSIPLELAPEDIKIGDLIGEGVYSEVYKGFCYGTQTAVKKFKNQSFDPELLAQVAKEVRIMKSIRHPNLLLFLGACTKPGQLMIVTELMDKSFHDLDASSKDLFTKLRMAREAAKGISWLHSLTPAIVHRDLKPENILCDQSGKVVKVADFGLSLVKDHSKQEAEEMKKVRGSPAFMSPEALLGLELDSKADVYSFGMILWELYTGNSPYDDLEIDSFEQLIEEICEKNTRETIPAECPTTLRSLIEACWQRNPKDRPTFIEILQKLDECLLEVAIDEDLVKSWWKNSFVENGVLRIEVPWEEFLNKLSCHPLINLNPIETVFVGLKYMLDPDDKGTVKIQSFGNILRWFGPFADKNKNFLETMQELFQQKWFHGDISQKTAQTRLAGTKPGTFLIRFSSNPGSYAISKIIENQNKETAIVHIRIAHWPSKAFSFVLDEKVYEFDSLQKLVQSDLLFLGEACPGSKYFADFRIKQVVSGYISTST